VQRLQGSVQMLQGYSGRGIPGWSAIPFHWSGNL